MATNIGNMYTTLVGRTRGFQRMRQTLDRTQARANTFSNKAGRSFKNFSFMSRKYTNATINQIDRIDTKMVGWTKNFKGYMAKARKSWMGVANQIQVGGERFMRIGYYTSMYLTLPLVAAGAAAVAFQKRFGKVTHQLVNLMDISQEKMAQWKESIFRMAPKTGFVPFELIRGLQTIIQNGVEAGDAMNVLRESAKAAGAGLQRSVLPIATATASAISVYGKEILSAKDATAVFLKLIAEEGMQPRMLSQTIGKVISSARDLNIELQDVAAALDIMTDTGESAIWAGLQLNQLFGKLVKPTKKSEQALRSVGSSTTELRKILGERGLGAMLQRIMKLWKQNSGALKGNILNQRAYQALLKATRGGTEKFMETFKEWNEELGNTDEKFAQASKTMQMTWKRALATVTTGFAKLGGLFKDKFAKALMVISGWISKLADYVDNLSASGIEAFMVWAKWVALIGPFSMGLGLVSSILGNLVNVVGQLIGVLRGALIPWRFITGAIIVAGVAIWRHIKRQKEQREELIKTQRVIDSYGKSMRMVNNIGIDATKELRNQRTELPVYRDRLKDVSSELNQFKNRLKDVKKGSIDYQVISRRIAALENIRQRLLNDINAEYGQYLDKELKMSMTYATMAKHLSDVNDELERRIKVKAFKSVEEKLFKKASATFLTIRDIKKRKEELKKLMQEAHNPSSVKAYENELNVMNAALLVNEQEYENIKKKIKAVQEEMAKLKIITGDTTDESEKDWKEYFQTIINGLNSAKQAVMSFRDKIQMVEWKSALFEDFDYFVEMANLYRNKITELLETKVGGKEIDQAELKRVVKLYNVYISKVKEASDETEQSTSIWKQLQHQLDVASIKERQLGDEFDENRAKLRAYQQAMNKYAEIVASGEATDQQIKNMEKVKRRYLGLKEEIKSLKEETLDWEDISKRAASILGRVYAQMAQSIGQSLAQQENAMQSFVSTALRTVQQFLAVMLAKAAGAIIAGESVEKGLVGLLFGATVGIAALNAAWQKNVQSQMDKAQGMASGGTVPSGYSNDSYPAMLSSGEKVLPPEDLDNEKLDGTMQIEIDGRIGFDELAFAVSEYSRKKSNTF